MIKSFTHKGLRVFFYEGTKKGIQTKHTEKLVLILDRLDAALTLQDMNYPGARFHSLKGEYGGFYSVAVSGNWRVIFRLEAGNVFDVDYIDYH